MYHHAVMFACYGYDMIHCLGSQCDDTRESNKAVQGEEEEFSAPLRDKGKLSSNIILKC